MARTAAWIAAAASLSLLACVQIGTDTGTGTTTATDGGTATTSDGATSPAFTGCATDSTLGLTLCLAVAACPNLSIDQTAFPSCGFREGGSSELDLECLCNGMELCPIGAPASCNDVVTLLTQEQSALQVCEQVSSGTCITLGGSSSSSGSGSGGSSGSGSGGSTVSSACQTCTASCGETPACYESCGC